MKLFSMSEATPAESGHGQVTDAHLAALCLERKGRLVTFDRAVADVLPASIPAETVLGTGPASRGYSSAFLGFFGRGSARATSSAAWPGPATDSTMYCRPSCM